MAKNTETRRAPLVCPIHGPLEPGWTSCPYCQQATRENARGGGRTRQQKGPQQPRSLSERGTQRTVAAGPDRTGQGSDETIVRPAGPVRQGRGRVAHTERIQRPPELLAWLIMKEGTRVGQVTPLSPEGTDLGRDPTNHIVIDDSKVSAFHAKVQVGEEKQLVVWDLASANGTFVNGERVMAPVTIVENDEIKLGTTVLVLKTLE